MTRPRRPYIWPTPSQRRLIAALIETGTVREASIRVGVTWRTGQAALRQARERTGLNTMQLIAYGVQDGWLPQSGEEAR